MITIADLTQAGSCRSKTARGSPFPSQDEQLTFGRPAASVDAGDADRGTGLAEQADEIRALVAARDYRQGEERLTRLATEDPQQAESLLLELGFIALPDPDRQIVATAWSAIAVGRTVQSLLAEDGISAAHGLPETASAATPPVAGSTGPIEARRLRSARHAAPLSSRARCWSRRPSISSRGSSLSSLT